MTEQQHPRIGMGVLIVRDGKILMGKRKGSHAAGEYALPGGHLEYMESFEDCARREVREETGLEIENIKFLVLTTIRDYPPTHYVLVAVLADAPVGEPQTLEPNKNEGWYWYDVNELPSPLFRPSALAIEAFRRGEPIIDLTS